MRVDFQHKASPGDHSKFDPTTTEREARSELEIVVNSCEIQSIENAPKLTDPSRIHRLRVLVSGHKLTRSQMQGY